MGQQLTGGALALLGTAPVVFGALDAIGDSPTEVHPFFLLYGVLLVLLGGGVYAGEIRFEPESTGKYKGLIFLYATVVLMGIVVSVLITLS
jgi:hypothetical protein